MSGRANNNLLMLHKQEQCQTFITAFTGSGNGPRPSSENRSENYPKIYIPEHTQTGRDPRSTQAVVGNYKNTGPRARTNV